MKLYNLEKELNNYSDINVSELSMKTICENLKQVLTNKGCTTFEANVRTDCFIEIMEGKK